MGKRRRSRRTRPAKEREPDTNGSVSGNPLNALNSAEAKKKPSPKDALAEVEKQIAAKIQQLEKLRHAVVYPFFLESIDAGTVDDVFDDIRQKISSPVKNLDVVVHSSGGDIHAAFNLGMLFRRYATDRLSFIVPRWAKSAATLLVCAGDEVLLGPISELGPVDPQITTFNMLENRLEQISPLYLKATLELIRSEFQDGNDDLAKGLLHRLQFPLTLGGFTRSLELGEGYIKKLLKTRMFSALDDKERTEKASKAAETLVRAYEDHGYCIELDEARTMGLRVREMNGRQFDIVWEIFRLNDKATKIRAEEKKREIEELLKSSGPGDLQKRSPQKRMRKHDLSQ